MAIQVRVDSDEARAALKGLASDVQARASEMGLRWAALAVERRAKQKLTESGRHPKGTPTPSAPGSPPAIVTGALRASVKAGEVRREGFGVYRVEIGPTIVYGRVQELGGGPRNLPARPYMAPTAQEAGQEVRDAYLSAVRKYAHG